MYNIVKHTLYTFLAITFLSAILVIVGLCYLWFVNDKATMPNLDYLMGLVLVEVIAVIIVLAKKGLKYLPEIQTDKDQKDTLAFMRKFISTGSSATIVSNRASWLARNEELVSVLKAKIDQGIRVEIITPKSIEDDFKNKLSGAIFIVTGETISPESRFTLLNGERTGSERLAIARGVHPYHEITIFDNSSGPQIIAMAKDIIRKSKAIANAE